MCSDWKRVRLGDHITTQKGFAFKSKWYTDRGRSIVKVSDFTADSVDVSSLVSIPEEIAASYLRYELSEGDVVIQTVGSWPSNPQSVVGKAIRVPRDAGGALLNQNAVKIIPGVEFDRTFLFYLLRCENFKEYIVGTAQGAASQASITLDSIRYFAFDLPPLSVQSQIAAILSAYDDLIENNLRRIKILEEMAQNLYHEWFVKFRFPGHEQAHMIDSALGEIPKDWSVASLGQLSVLKKDKYKEAIHADLPLLDLAKMLQRTLLVGAMGNPDELSTSRIIFEEDDVLFGSIRPYLHKVALAPCDGVTNVSVLVIRPNQSNYRAMLAVLLSSIDAIRWADQHSTGTKMPVIKWESFSEMPVVLPDDDILLRFQEIVWPMLQSIKTASRRIKNLRETRDLLLPKLISGELDVSELDIDIGEAA